jgi:hypothetical protein
VLDKKETYYCNSCQNSIVKGKYCPDCGVYNSGKKSSLKSLFSNVFSEALSFEKGLFHNFKLTFSKPNEIVWSYFNGIRNKYAAPGKFFLYTLLILGVIYLIDPEFGVLDVTVEEESTNALTGTKIFLILITPLLSITSKIVFWRNKGMAIHVISIVYLFLPRFVIVSAIITAINLSIGQNWSQPLLVLILLLNTFWTNVTVQKIDSTILQKIGFMLLQLTVMLGLITLIIIGFILFGNFDLQVN